MPNFTSLVPRDTIRISNSIPGSARKILSPFLNIFSFKADGLEVYFKTTSSRTPSAVSKSISTLGLWSSTCASCRFRKPDSEIDLCDWQLHSPGVLGTKYLSLGYFWPQMCHFQLLHSYRHCDHHGPQIRLLLQVIYLQFLDSSHLVLPAVIYATANPCQSSALSANRVTPLAISQCLLCFELQEALQR